MPQVLCGSSERIRRAWLVDDVAAGSGRSALAGLPALGQNAAMTATSPPSPATPPTQPGSPPGRVVVGVDGSPGSLAALRWALHEARLRGAELRAVLAWQPHPTWAGADVISPFTAAISSGAGIGGMLPSDVAVLPDASVAVASPYSGRQEAEAAANNVLDSALAAVAEPAERAVRITQAAVEGHAANALLANVTPADLLVVGSRGHGEFARALLGSISQHVVAHAPCPVVVVPDSGRSAS